MKEAVQQIETRKDILIADDEKPILRLLDYNLGKRGYNVITASDGKEALEAVTDDLKCALIDLKMPELDGIELLTLIKKTNPDLPVIVMSAVGQVKDAVLAMKKGAFEYVTKPFDLDELFLLTETAVRYGEALSENRGFRGMGSSPVHPQELVGNSAVMQKLREQCQAVASLDSTVLINGESGVGQGVLARAIHQASKRNAETFLTVSCPALPTELLESELFGHEKGAFTGAHQRRVGRFELVGEGTLFLDEIGDLPLSLQAKLLNVLQDREFTRVGGTKLIKTRFRLIAATNVDVQEKIQQKEFREDLYYRLNVINMLVPPLRARLEDLPMLVTHILSRISQARNIPGLGMADETMAILAGYSWPGNVRELENIIERASAFCRNSQILPEDLPPELKNATLLSTGRNCPEKQFQQWGSMSLEELERIAIIQTLESCGGNKAAAARSLGITEKSIYNKMARHGLKKPKTSIQN